MNTQVEQLKYPVSLALFDYAPVVFTLAGYLVLVAVLPQAFAGVFGWAVAGAVLMFTGGFLKATWKTIIAGTERDIRWMEHSLFLFLTPGATLFAWAILKASAAQSNPGAAASNASVAVPIVLTAVFIGMSLPRLPKSKKWFLPLVALLTIAVGVISITAALMANEVGKTLAAVLFIASFAVSLVTAGLSRRAATIKAQWAMEWANTGSSLLFLLGALSLGNMI